MSTRPDQPRLPRAVIVFVALACGLVIGRAVPAVQPAAWFGAACAALAVAALARGRACSASLAAACILLGAGWFGVRIYERPGDALSAHLAGDESVTTVTGIILETPTRTPIDPDPLARQAFDTEPTWRYRLRVDSVDAGNGPLAVRGVLQVRSAEPPVAAGDRVRITGVARPVPPPMNPGERDRRLLAAQEGVAGSLRAPRTDLIEPLPSSPGLLVRLRFLRIRWAAALHDRVRSLIDVDAGGDGTGPGALLGALLLGEEAPALRDIRSAFTRLGIAHVLAISGFHMVVLAGVALLALRLSGDGGWVEPVIVAAVVVAYLAILPVSAPVWRSGLMVLALLAADAAGRRYDRLAVLAWTAVALVLWRPMDLWSIGFQLSFGLLAVLIRFGPVTHSRIWGARLRGLRRGPPEGAWSWAGEQFRRLVSTSVLCWAASAPLIAYHTGNVSLLAVVSSVIVVPVITILLGASYAGIAVGLVIPAAVGLIAPLLKVLAAATVEVVWWFDEVPIASVRVAPVSLAWAAAATLVMLYVLTRARRREWVAWIALLAIAGWLVLEQSRAGRLPRDVVVRIDTLSVGDGTSHVVRAGGSAILWDCGSTVPGIGRVTVPRAVFALGLRSIETAVITHPDLDHYNGLLDAAGPLGIRTVYVGECFTEQAATRPAGPEAYLMGALATRGIEVRVLCAGDSVPLGDARVEILSPPRGVRWVKPNDRSLVGRLNCGRSSILLTGDIEAEAMDWLREHQPGLHATVVEAPHHGSARPAAYEFVTGLAPAIVIQSTGPDRVDDPRWDGVRQGRVWRTTPTDGALATEFFPGGLVTSEGFRR